MDAPVGFTQEEDHTGFLDPFSEVLALMFIARRIQSPLTLVDHEVEFCVPTKLFVLHLLRIYLFFGEEKSQFV